MEKITFDFKDRTALVTGGAQGFGLDIAKRFLNSGAKVIIWDIDPKMLDKVVKDLNNPNLSYLNLLDVCRGRNNSCMTSKHVGYSLKYLMDSGASLYELCREMSNILVWLCKIIATHLIVTITNSAANT